MSASNGHSLSARVEVLENQVQELAWYHAELSVQFKAVAIAFAALLAQQLQPQVQQQVLDQLLQK